MNYNPFPHDYYGLKNCIPIRDHGVTYIIIKNCLNGEVEYENNERSAISNNVPVKKSFTRDEAYAISKKLGIDFAKEKYLIEDFKAGLDVELEHGRRDMRTNVTNDDPILTGKIALAHLNEFPDYYRRLKKLEEDAKAYWQNPTMRF